MIEFTSATQIHLYCHSIWILWSQWEVHANAIHILVATSLADLSVPFARPGKVLTFDTE